MPGNFESSIPVSSVPYHEPQDTAANWLEKGDFVQARHEALGEDGTPQPALVTSFTITGINGSRVYGSPHYPDGLSQKEDWYFDVISRGTPLPTTLSEIDATLSDGTTAVLMGKGEVWTRAEGGMAVPAMNILKWALHQDEAPEEA